MIRRGVQVGPLWLRLAAVVCLQVALQAFEIDHVNSSEADVRERANRFFDSAWLVKPPESGDTNHLAWRLAPIFVLEAVPGSATNQANVSPAATSRPLRRIFAAERASTFDGKAALQIIYFWNLDSLATAEGPSAHKQGIIVTVNSEGWPLITEVITNDSNSRVLFLTEKLGRAAEQRPGAALSGRIYAVERKGRPGQKVIVPRVIQDGPVPMGPMVYVSRDQRTITTVLCRCMPSQVKSIEGGFNYELRLTEWPPELVAAGRDLDECLRVSGTEPTFMEQLNSFEPDGLRR
jgi:hypothetical protein